SPPALDATLRIAYHPGRVEVFGAAPQRQLWAYDVRSLFAAAMASAPLPSRYRGRATRLLGSQYGVAYCSIRSPHGIELPYLPYRHKDSTYCPTGSWDSWLALDDIEHAGRLGYRITVREWLVYDTTEDFAHYVADIYRLRAAAREGGLRLEQVYK